MSTDVPGPESETCLFIINYRKQNQLGGGWGDNLFSKSISAVRIDKHYVMGGTTNFQKTSLQLALTSVCSAPSSYKVDVWERVYVGRAP